MRRWENGPRRTTAGALLLALAGMIALAGGPVVAAGVDGERSGERGLSPKRPYQAAPLPRAVGAGGDTAWTQTKPVVRELVDADGSRTEILDPMTGAPYQVTVTADHTQNLRGRERVGITWSGAQPSAGRANDPFGASGMRQEYPVVVLQCRGQGDQVRPETCWTSSFGQRSQVSKAPGDAVWTEDLHAAAADKEKVTTAHGPLPSAEECPTVDTSGAFYTRLTPFVSAKGVVYAACDAQHMPPEAAAGAALPAAEIAAFTDADGNGSAQFEVRTDVENESLGCSKAVACSIVVIPISGISCEQASAAAPAALTDEERGCRRTGQFAAGSSNFTSMGVDQAVAPDLWWAASNWRNRFVIPITIGDPPDTCDVLDPRPPTGFYGSELLAQASLQWAPAYCLNKKRFKFQFNQMPDEAGWSLMANGGGPAAIVSSQHEPGSDPVGYAPTAVTGFAIGHIIDRPGNSGEYTNLRLNARLIAKLLTQSYPGSSFGAGHPGMERNPWAIMSDPEFIALNPGLSTEAIEPGATLLSLSNSSDLVQQLTAYLATDKSAMEFVNGKADPWGMRVNPSYLKIKLPRNEWPLLDTYVPTGGTECRANNPSTYFNDLAAPVTTLRKIAEALLDAWPNVQTRCDTDLSASPPIYKVGRVERLHYGQRFMLGLVSLGDAARYGLHTAALEARKGTYVAPTTASLSAAVAITEQPKGRFQPFLLDQKDVRRSATAYPGTMITYTAARLRNLPKADAAKVAQFIRIATTEGQRPGSGNGQLPLGFLPIERKGTTAKLFAAAQGAADAIEKQAPARERATPPPAAAPDAPVAALPVSVPPAAPAGVPAPSEPAVHAMPETQAVRSDLGGGLLPLLGLLGLVAGLCTAVVRTVLPLRGRR